VHGKPYRCVAVDTTLQMHDAVVSELCDRTVLVMAAAPADWAPAMKENRKIKRDDEKITLELVRTVDILMSVARLRRTDLSSARLFVAGFAAETHDIEEYAAGKLERKMLDMICVNDVSGSSAGFGSDTNELVVLSKDGSRLKIPLMDKSAAADMIIKQIISRIDF
jgi:phosphopantothenoylcysteine decarboxylase/phosphopantothenate--cysteine ligase